MREDLILRLEKAVQDLTSQVSSLSAHVAVLRNGREAPTAPAPAGDFIVEGRVKLAMILGVDAGEISVKLNPKWIADRVEQVVSYLFPRKLVTIRKRGAGANLYCYSDGYLRRDGVQFLVNEFLRKQMERGEQFAAALQGESVTGCFVLFDPPGQQCWLVGTQSLIFYVQEEAGDRVATEENIAWILPKEDRQPVLVRVKDKRVNIGPMVGWRYSPHKFEGPEDLRDMICGL